jgi:5-methylcytosine-specific restriction endonuclease McrA
MKQFTRKCQWCLDEFQTEWETKEYCSRSHKEQAREFRKKQRRRTVRTLFVRECIGCAHSYSTYNRQKLYCSEECREFTKQQIRRERDRQFYNRKNPSFKRRIYFASNGRCGICGEIIDLQFKYPNEMSLSLDHIIPVSLGGSHAATNLQAAHLGCNTRRGNAPLVEQISPPIGDSAYISDGSFS